MIHSVNARSFLVADAKLRELMMTVGKPVHTATWQGIDISKRPEAKMYELLNVSLHVELRGIGNLEHWRQEIRPNLPWADEHFEERVSGKPLNPPPSWVRWPYAHSASNFREAQKFNHTYPERFWPKFAGIPEDLGPHDPDRGPHYGIRWQYGDLGDVVKLLAKDPLTRQAYLPMFFPEDTGIGDGGRKPCTLGYQFIMRDGYLHCFYPMRSTDILRHLRDDIYLAVRLLLWVQNRLVDEDVVTWGNVKPGSLSMHMTSLHCFTNDLLALRKEREDAITKGLG